MTLANINLKHLALQEANRVVAPLLRAKQDARIALDQAVLDYNAAWRQAYRNAVGRNNGI